MQSIRLHIVRSLKMCMRVFLFLGVCMVQANRIFRYFSKTELALWGFSVLSVSLSFYLFDKESYLTLIASLIGVTSLIFNAKGNPVGQILMVVFSLLYGIISFSFSYYGEMVTYLGMTLPMSVFALISWLKNPYSKSTCEVKVNMIGRVEIRFMWILTAVITVLFYFILRFFGTANLIPSTLSIATSFLAAYLTFRRSPLFALAYAANDAVLFILWFLACLADRRYGSVFVCFAVFLANDIYGYISWQKMKKRQLAGSL